MKPPLALSLSWLPADDTHSVSCCICNGANPAETVFSFTLNGATFTIVRCIKDDLMYLSPQPGERYAEALYNHPSYFSELNDMYGHRVTEEKGKVTAGYRMQEIVDHGITPKNFLEIGCGRGYTLEAVQEKGIVAHGIEFSKESVAETRTRGLNVFEATLEMSIPEGIKTAAPYDVIALYSVLEHVPNPTEFLQALRGLLAPQGTLIVRVPKMSIEGPWLSLLDHFWHFTQESLATILSQAGFTTNDVFPSGNFTSTKGDILENMTAFASLT
jgi:2-polyprenyl-3-methyl-5-hydroxy-6-metoxy-1,4-benzoquinol methylase